MSRQTENSFSSASIWSLLDRTKVLPVVVLEDSDTAVPVAKALVAGGVPIAEITLRTPAATDAIHDIVDSCPEVCVGAGTVLSAHDVDRAADAGASFLVSPGLSEEVIARALERQVPLIPGVATATEIQRAQGLGFTHLKFFPAEPSGGPKALRAFKGPFPCVNFIPTGGVTKENASHYLKTGNVLAVGGTWIVPSEIVGRGDFGSIAEVARLSREHLGGSL
jgi:2-dehydro-3-deoxyphosphogluconate aldolase/(4S)-4-hydroxy-2-oxoglutarate aldolase